MAYVDEFPDYQLNLNFVINIKLYSIVSHCCWWMKRLSFIYFRIIRHTVVHYLFELHRQCDKYSRIKITINSHLTMDNLLDNLLFIYLLFFIAFGTNLHTISLLNGRNWNFLCHLINCESLVSLVFFGSCFGQGSKKQSLTVTMDVE